MRSLVLALVLGLMVMLPVEAVVTTLTASPTEVSMAGDTTMTVEWTDIAAPDNENYLEFTQVAPNPGRNNPNHFWAGSCQWSASPPSSAPPASGSCQWRLKGTGSVNPGTYVWKLYDNASRSNLLATSNPITVTPPPTPTP